MGDCFGGGDAGESQRVGRGLVGVCSIDGRLWCLPFPCLSAGEWPVKGKGELEAPFLFLTMEAS